ncbi:MAG TPA: POTRA domain-containing protein [Terracidiphilus sp.]|nr:POTRA domain-containing protein [Terracidiphilus sp.]
MRRPVFFLIISLLVLCAAYPSAAQKFQPKTIQFKGDPEYSDEELLAAAGLKKGVVLTSAEMNDHSKALMDSGVFDNLTYKFDGVDLIYILTPAELLYPIHLENLPFAPGTELDAKLHDRLPLYHGKVPSEGGLLESVRAALEDLLASQGIKAIVTATPYTDIKLHKVTALSFSITSPPVQVGEIHLDPASPALDPKAQEILAKQSGSDYDVEGSSSQIISNLGNFYRESGYLEAAVQATPQLTPAITPDAIRIPFVVSLLPGPLYKIASVQIAPGLAVTQADFDHQSGIHPGDIADSVRLRQNWSFIERQYHNKGYMKATVLPKPSFDHGHGTVSFSVTVVPGPVYTMGKFSVENVTDDLRAQIVAAWGMAAGAVFNEGAIRGFFATVGVHPALERVFATVNLRYVLRSNDDSHTVDVALFLSKKQ